MHAHNVYFSFIEPTEENTAALVADAYEYLAKIDGIEFFACGTHEALLDREVNDHDWDVGLHVVFTDLAAHDAYQVAPSHDEFVARNKDNWQSVRVFDTVINH